jgi:transposase-like protein
MSKIRYQLTIQELDTAISMIKSGVPIEHIANSINIDEQVLFRQLKKAGFCSKC